MQIKLRNVTVLVLLITGALVMSGVLGLLVQAIFNLSDAATQGVQAGIAGTIGVIFFESIWNRTAQWRKSS